MSWLPQPGWKDADSGSSSHRQLCFCFQSPECRHPSSWTPEPISRVDESPLWVTGPHCPGACLQHHPWFFVQNVKKCEES